MTTVTDIMTDLGWTFRAGEWRKPGKLISHTNTLDQLLAHAGEDAFRQFIGWIGVPVTQKETPMPEEYSFEALTTTMENMGWNYSNNTWQKGALTLPGVLGHILENFGKQALIQLVTEFENRQVRKDENRPLPETAYATQSTWFESPVKPKTHFIVDPAVQAYALAHDEADVERIAKLWAEGDDGDDSEYLIGQITKRVTTRTTREIKIEPIQEAP